jgi:hypothetical protein
MTEFSVVAEHRVAGEYSLTMAETIRTGGADAMRVDRILAVTTVSFLDYNTCY